MPEETEKIAELSIPYGRWFVRGCSFVQDRFGAPPKKIEVREKRAKKDVVMGFSPDHSRHIFQPK